MYKIAVFSDIHGNYEALEAILNDIRKDIFDEVIYLGDLINLGPDSYNCVKRVLESDIQWILGNHDLYFCNGLENFDIEQEKLEHYKFIFNQLSDISKKEIKKKKTEYKIEINNHSLRFNHYFIKNKKDYYPFYSIGEIKNKKINDLISVLDTEYTFYGHDHKPSQYKFDDKYLIDVGSSGCVKNNKTFYTIIEIDENVKVYKKEIKFNRKKLEEKLLKSFYPSIEHISKEFFGIENLQKKI